MADSLGQAVLELLTDDARFNQAIDLAGKKAHSLGETFEQVEKIGLLMFTGIAAGSAALIKTQINAADATGKMAQSAGIGAEKLSEMVYAGRLADVGQEALAISARKLNTNIMDTASGTGEADAAFRAMGITVKNADGTLKSADQVLEDVANRFQTYEDGAGKSALATLIFGRAGAQMIPMLNDGAEGLHKMAEEAHQLGDVFDQETSKAAERVNDNLTRLNRTVAGETNRVMRELLPILVDTTDAMVAQAKASSDLGPAGKGVIILFQALTVLGGNVAFVLKGVGNEIGGIAAQLVALASGDFEGASQIGDMMKADAKKAREEFDKWEQTIMTIGQARADTIDNFDLMGDMSKLGKKKAPTLPNKDALKKAYESQLAEIRAFGEQYSAAIRLQNALVQEAQDQGMLGSSEVIQQTAAGEDARLQVIIQGLKKEEALHRNFGETSKAREAQLRIDQLEAERMANDAITTARLSSLEQRLQLELAANENRFNQEIAQMVEGIRRENLTEMEMINEQYAQKQSALDVALKYNLISSANYQKQRELLELQHQAKLGNIAAQGALARRKFEQMSLQQQAQTIFGELANITAGVAQHNRVLFNLNKAAGIANAIINAYIGISRTLASYPYPINIAMAAVHAAVAFAQVSAISSQQFGGGATSAPSIAGSTPATPVTDVQGGAPDPLGQDDTKPEKEARPIARHIDVHLHVSGKYDRPTLETIAEGLNELADDGFPLRFHMTTGA